MEAMWHLLKYEMHDKSHTIYRMSLHLPNDQLITFRMPVNEEHVRIQAGRNTMLTGWFELNRNDPLANPYTYLEIGTHYVWNASARAERGILARTWTPRQRGGNTIISRLYTINPRMGELYFLRILLHHVRGCRSYEDVRTHNGVVYDTFKDACIARNLLRDDQESRNTMREAVEIRMPSQLRRLFVSLVVFQNPMDIPALYEEFRDDMMEDFLRNHQHVVAENMLLHVFNTLFDRTFHRNNLYYNLPLPNEGLLENAVFEDALIRTTRYTIEEHQQFAREHAAQLNVDQRAIFNELMTQINLENPNIVRAHFVDGPGGMHTNKEWGIGIRGLLDVSSNQR